MTEAADGLAQSPPLDHTQADPLAQLHRYITLPLALHIPPLPSLHYQAVPNSPEGPAEALYASLQESADSTDPQGSKIGNNLNLQSLVLQPPPLDLDTISFLLEASNAAHAIKPFAQLLQLLESADPDPHFTNLIAFFDARYDLKNGGVLEGAQALEDPRDHDQRQRSTSVAQRQGMLGRMVSRSKHHNTSPRKASSAGGPIPRSARPSASLGQSGTMLANFRRTGSLAAANTISPLESGNATFPSGEGEGESVFLDDDGDAFAVASSWGHESYEMTTPANSKSSTIAPPRYAPHLIVPLRANQREPRSVAFPVRLDLQNAGRGLCPPPPLPSTSSEGAGRGWAQQSFATPASPTFAESSSGSRPMSRAARMRSPSQPSAMETTTSSSGFASRLTRVISPGSVVSGHSRYSSHSGDDSPADIGGAHLGRQTSIGSTRDTNPANKNGQVTSGRRSSALSRIMSFRRGKKREPSFGGSVFSGTGSSDVGGENRYTAEEDWASRDIPPVPPVPSHLLSPAPIGEKVQEHSARGDDNRQRDLLASGDFEADMADLNLSPSSKDQPFSSFGGTGAAAALSLDNQPYGSHLPYTAEGEELERYSSSRADAVVEGTVMPSWAGADADVDGGSLKDFLSLFREAAETALLLPSEAESVDQTTASPAGGTNGMSEKAKGKQPASAAPALSPLDTPSSEKAAVGHADSLFPPISSPGASRRSSSPHSRRSVFGDLEIPGLAINGQEKSDASLDGEGDDDEDLFTRCRRGKTSNEAEPWWPSGGVDPLPVSILSALGLAFGWKGILRLCYGPGAPVTRGENGGELAPLGKAVAMTEAERREQQGASREDDSGEVSKKSESRTWSDWHRLATSISKWVELYEMTRIRSGLSREIGLDPLPNPDGRAKEPLATQAQYSLTSGVIPAAVASDASTRSHAYRRRLGIPEGLPANEDGVELGDYRWSRSKLGPASAATSLTLASASLAHYLGAIEESNLSYATAWELDYLEALVLKSPVIAERFPAPIGRPVSLPIAGMEGGDYARAKACPYPGPDGSFDPDEWERWLLGQTADSTAPTSHRSAGLKGGDVLTPAVSVQAWWACIAIISSSTGSRDTAIDLQILGKDEDWRDVAAAREPEDSVAVYI